MRSCIYLISIGRQLSLYFYHDSFTSFSCLLLHNLRMGMKRGCPFLIDAMGWSEVKSIETFVYKRDQEGLILYMCMLGEKYRGGDRRDKIKVAL